MPELQEEKKKAADAYLHAHGIAVSSELIDDMIRHALERVERAVSGRTREEVSPTEASVLEDGGFDLADRDHDGRDPVARTAAMYAALLKTALTTTEAARLLGVHPSRVRQRLQEGTLYGLRAGSEWRIPEFQFFEGELLPGGRQVFPEIDRELHPVAVFQWFTAPNPDLFAEEPGEELSPREWLATGRAIEPVVRLAENL